MPPVFIPVPGGATVSGVTLFAVRLARVLAERGASVTLAVHAAPAGHRPIDLSGGLADGVRVADCSHLGALETMRDAGAGIVPTYRDAIEQALGDAPTVMVLGQHESVFAAGAALSQVMPDRIRAIGVVHSDNGYDLRVVGRYAPMLSHAVGVSDSLHEALARGRAFRPDMIRMIPYGVEVPESPPARPPLGGRAVRLLYAGRLEHRQKRILALPMLARELARRAISTELTIAGDGPAATELAASCAGLPGVSLTTAVDPTRVRALLNEHDAFILPSRFEGLSVAMLEALAHGCVPIVAPSRSGTAQAVRSGLTGEIAAVDPDHDESATALALADAVEAFLRRDPQEMAARCHADARARFSIEAHGQSWRTLLVESAASPPAPWPLDQPCAFPGTPEGADRCAEQRLLGLLERIGGEPLAIHGTGRFARAMLPLLADANIVAVTDDDRQRHGRIFLGRRISAPADLAGEARHLIILSALHEEDIWRRRAVYEDRGVAVHRLHAAEE
ncbi:MAG: glycosyltransferase family 4 protein [Phycisphaerales bacterium]